MSGVLLKIHFKRKYFLIRVEIEKRSHYWNIIFSILSEYMFIFDESEVVIKKS